MRHFFLNALFDCQNWVLYLPIWSELIDFLNPAIIQHFHIHGVAGCESAYIHQYSNNTCGEML